MLVQAVYDTCLRVVSQVYKHDRKTMLYWTPEQDVMSQGYPYLLP